MNSFGNLFRCTTFGESHGEAVGCVIDGCPAGIEITAADIERELERDIPNEILGTTRRESNKVKIVSGMYNNITIGTPICILIENTGQKSRDYSPMERCYRPGHAEYTYHQRYGIYHPHGGGRASGRECIARLAIGAVAKKILELKGILFESRVVELGGYTCRDGEEEREAVEKCMDVYNGTKDSTGGIVALTIKGVPPGVGSPVFGKLNALIMYALGTIGGVKGIENGAGFETARMTGNECNDPFGIIMGSITPLDNKAGGVLGGISTGMDLTFRIAVKPTPTVAIPQKSVDWRAGEEIVLDLNGRFDKNFTPRVGPIAESMAAMVIIDQMMSTGLINPTRIDG